MDAWLESRLHYDHVLAVNKRNALQSFVALGGQPLMLYSNLLNLHSFLNRAAARAKRACRSRRWLWRCHILYCTSMFYHLIDPLLYLTRTVSYNIQNYKPIFFYNIVCTCSSILQHLNSANTTSFNDFESLLPLLT